MSETTDTPLFDPFEPGFTDWPYGQYARLRDAGPVLPSPLGGWQLFAYDDCFRLLREPGLSVDVDNVENPTFRTDAFDHIAVELGVEQQGNRSILELDPPDHTRLRKLVARVFTPRAIEALRPEVQRLVDEALEGIEPGDHFDLISTLAFPLPFQVISHMLGMPEADDTAQLRDWSHTLAGTLDPVFDENQIRRAFEASLAMRAHLTEVIAWKRANPADDLLSGLISKHEDGDQLTDQELLDQVTLLFIAGHETTVNLIGNGTLALLEHRSQWERLVSDPGLIGNAVEECLRFDPPVQMTRRVTTAPYEVHDQEIPAGEFVMAMTAAANRDPARWGDDADDLDITRPGAGHHLSFGSGIHHCLGAALARMEGQVAIGTLAARLPGLVVDGELVRNHRIVLRGLDELPLRA